MIISTRGRYALRILIDIAENGNGEYIPLKQIAQRQGISLKYLEQILPVLTQNGVIEGVRGRDGGYRLVRSPNEYKIGDILRLTEGDITAVSCLGNDAKQCIRADECRTLPLWTKLNEIVNEYLDSVRLSDLVKYE